VSAAPLRIGVALADWRAPRWVTRSLADLAAADFVAIDAVLIAGAGTVGPPGGLYTLLDRQLFPILDDALAVEDARAALSGVPVVDAAALEARGLDALVAFPGAAAPEVGARHGTWTFELADAEEVEQATPCSQARLVRADAALARAVVSTRTTSLHRNRNAAAWQAADLPRRALLALWHDGTPPLDEARDPAPTAPLAGRPSGRTLALRVAGRLVADRLERAAFRERWFVAFRCHDRLEAWRRIEAPPGRFFADPFALDDPRGSWILFEDSPIGRDAGVISCVHVERDGRVGPVSEALSEPHHLSYPFVFRWRGEQWLLPEASASGVLTLYRATAFPHAWERHAELLSEVPVVDPTLLEHAGRWWLFAGLHGRGASNNSELHLFHADSPLGPFVAHRANPVVVDVRRARPAGRLRREGGVLLRPGQDSASAYGEAVTWSRIERLDPDGYREIPVERVGPEWWPGSLRTHTIDTTARLEVRDGLVLESRWTRGFGLSPRHGGSAGRSR
jgi:hypothetical protein